MAKSGVLTVRLLSDTKDLEKGLGRASKQVKSTGEKFSDAGKKMTVFATVPVAAAMVGATKAASDLEQSVGGVESVFGEASDTIEDFGDTAAATAGLSKRQVNEMAAVIGAGLKGMGFEAQEAADTVVDLEKRAADMAATFGGTTEEAIDAVASALRGERDPIEKYGVSLKQADVNARVMAMGLDVSTTAAKKKSEAIATLDLLMGQTADTEGQFAREAEGAAGSMQIAKAEIENASAEIGSTLLPFVAKAAGGVADLAKGFGELPKPVQDSVLALAGLLAISGPLITATGKVMTGSRVAASAFETLRLKAMYASTGVKVLGGALGGLAILAVVHQLYQLADAAGDVEVNATKAAKATTEQLAQAFRELEAFDSGAGMEAFEQLAEQSIGTAKRLRDELVASGEDAERFDEILRDAATGEQRLAADTEAATGAVEEFGDETGDAEKPTKDLTDATEDLESAVTDTIDPYEDLTDAINEANDALTDQFDPLRKARDAMLNNRDAQRDVEDANTDAKKAQDELNAAIKEFGEKSPEAQDAARRFRDAQRGVEEANRDAQDSALDVTTASQDLAAKMRAGIVDIDAAKFAIDQWAEQGLITEQQATAMKDELALVALAASNLDGTNVKVDVTADTTRFWQTINDLFSGAAGVPIGIGDAGGPIVLPELHSGGVFRAPRPGGEGLAVLRDKERVLTPEQDRQGTGMAGANITVNNYYPKPDTADESTTRSLRKIKYAVGF